MTTPANAACNDLLYWRPSIIRIEFGHRFREIGGIFAKILRVDQPVLIDDERLHACIVVFCRVCDVGESSGRLSVDDIRFRAAFGRGALTIQPAEVVAVKGLGDIGRDELFPLLWRMPPAAQLGCAENPPGIASTIRSAGPHR